MDGTGAGALAPIERCVTGAPLWRDALRTLLVLAAAVVIAYPFLPHRVDPPPIVRPAFGGYVAICCNRPIDPVVTK